NVFCFSTCDRLDRTVRIIVIATDKNTGDIDVPLPDNAPTSRFNTQSPDGLAASDNSADRLSLLVSPLVLSAILPGGCAAARSLARNQAKATSSSRQQNKRFAIANRQPHKYTTQASSQPNQRTTALVSDQLNQRTAQASSQPNQRTTQANT
ncbi:MAG: hypothetical protein LBG68_04035, partial [Coriobacteriales bacterium]|nr:hypothetical protein [Coriobacteriales bacterium]